MINGDKLQQVYIVDLYRQSGLHGE